MASARNRGRKHPISHAPSGVWLCFVFVSDNRHRATTLPPSTRPGRKPMSLFQHVNRLLRDESGATAIEYGLIAALISVAAIRAFTAVDSSLTGIFNTVSSDL